MPLYPAPTLAGSAAIVTFAADLLTELIATVIGYPDPVDGSDAATARLRCLASAVTASAPGTRCRPIAETRSSIAFAAWVGSIC